MDTWRISLSMIMISINLKHLLFQLRLIVSFHCLRWLGQTKILKKESTTWGTVGTNCWGYPPLDLPNGGYLFVDSPPCCGINPSDKL